MPDHGIVVETDSGKIRGDRVGNGCVFKGIPYGASTCGENRFRPPVKPLAWDGIREVRAFGDGCIQNNRVPVVGTPAHSVYAFILENDDSWKLQSEDCLVLNVWCRDTGDQGKRPVMVWFHGGFFTAGSGSSCLFDGARLSERGDVVVVTVNHRLNVFGYLHLGEIDSRFEESGNAGMLDLVAALEWVRDNIARFGGDPGNVTIFGESGGGAKVSTLLAMPSAKGLFHKAIIQSGASIRANTRAEGTALARLLLDELGLSENEVAKLQDIDPDVLLKASLAAESRLGKNMLDGSFGCWAPLVDGIGLTHDPFDPVAPPESASVPLMVGTTNDELTMTLASMPGFDTISEAAMRAFLTPILGARATEAADLYDRLYPHEPPGYRLSTLITHYIGRAPAAVVAGRKTDQGKAPAYLYVMKWGTPVLGGKLRAMHALDVPLVFDNVALAGASLLGDGPEAGIVARAMSTTWLAFARSGNPNNSAIPHWPPYSRAKPTSMLFDVECRTSENHEGEELRFWSPAEPAVS